MATTAGELARYLQAELEGDASARISSISNPESAAAGDLIYVEQEKFRSRAEASKANCVIAPPGLSLAGKTVIHAAAPKLAFAKAAAWLLPATRPQPGVHPTAVIAATSKIASTAAIGPFAVVEDGVTIAGGTQIGAHCVIGANSAIGEDCILHPRVTLYASSRIGSRVIIHSGTVIGGDGFGYVFGEGKHWKFPQAGTVEIGDDVEIGCNTTIDRGSLGATIIAAGVKIDNLVQIAHNVQIGTHSIIASQVGISGSCNLGHKVMLGGQAGLGEHCNLEDGVVAGGQAGILPGKTIHANEIVWGTPARALDKFREEYAWYSRLPAMGKQLRRLATLES